MSVRATLLLSLTVGLAGCVTPQKNVTERPQPTCTCEGGCVSACPVESTTTSYRKVVRDVDALDEPPVESADPFEPAELYVDAQLEGDDLTAALASVAVEPGEALVVLRGDFARARGDELAILSAAGELLVYSGSSLLTKLELGEPVVDDEPALRAAALIDGRSELVVRHVEAGVERVTVCRVIGKAIGRVFDVEQASGTVSFVRRGDQRAILLTSPDGEATVYLWNRWEGVFRIPARAPTAPPTRSP